ncbi:prephenate dehydrogenase/arogenate dehydrogenase family protein [Streptomyces sp. DSM 41014]|uniref:Prephenate dehydrogenase/arogenate dehydrogenase family protein n=1 Tax=Streptomyces hintoniae TaxID=3075521 RepID=A0ABU2UTY6_9ACTN|nr:prephenate dehydrogenase/arogenate dehydrogenase family protein [Streptomyces sp. DSM 41014]MDT0476292.1 prephenate dehydrogenase/arogenate dehydrogenase family protein [Streptomyces sp. DSM 41014]
MREDRPRAVVVGGGRVGRLFTALLSGHHQLTVVDSVAQEPAPHAERLGVQWINDDATRPGPATAAVLAQAHVVVLALPEAAALACLHEVSHRMAAGALLVETLSVKTSISAALRAAAHQRRLEALGVNPMFAPELGFSGRPVAVVPLSRHERSERFLALLRGAGARVVPLAEDQHDRLTAALQVATHASVLAFGHALMETEAELELLCELAPPPHLTLLALLARICSGGSEVYWDVQAGNEAGAAVRAALSQGVLRLSELVAEGDRDGFDALLAGAADFLGARGPELAARCDALFRSPELS